MWIFVVRSRTSFCVEFQHDSSKIHHSVLIYQSPWLSHKENLKRLGSNALVRPFEVLKVGLCCHSKTINPKCTKWYTIIAKVLGYHAKKIRSVRSVIPFHCSWLYVSLSEFFVCSWLRRWQIPNLIDFVSDSRIWILAKCLQQRCGSRLLVISLKH